MINAELQHYGVLGMKWGVRKNPTKAYAKAYKKKKSLDDRSEKWDQNKKRRENEVSISRKTLATEKHNLEVERARKDLASRNLSETDKRYSQGSIYSLLGNRQRVMKKAQKALDEATESFNKQFDKTNRAILDNDTQENRLAASTRRANIAKKKAERWTRLMNSSFKDVPNETIQAGKELFEKRLKKK